MSLISKKINQIIEYEKNKITNLDKIIENEKKIVMISINKEVLKPKIFYNILTENICYYILNVKKDLNIINII